MSSQFHRTAAWLALTRRLRPILAAGLPSPCVQGRTCQRGGVVWPGQRFDCAHIIDAHRAPSLALDPINVGVAHRRCNRSDGGKAGAAITNRKRKRRIEGERFIRW